MPKGLGLRGRFESNIRPHISDFGVNCTLPVLDQNLGSSAVCVSSCYVGAKATLSRMKSAKEEKGSTSHRHK